MVKYLFLCSLLLLFSCTSKPSIPTESSESKFDLEAVLNMERQDLVAGEIMSHLYDKIANDVDLSGLNASEQVLFYIVEMEGQVYNGGFNQYYFNTSGEHAIEVVDALITIGAHNTAMLVKKANDEFPKSNVPKDGRMRSVVLSVIEDEASEVWTKLESAFYGTSEDPGAHELEDYLALLNQFVKENRVSFEK